MTGRRRGRWSYDTSQTLNLCGCMVGHSQRRHLIGSVKPSEIGNLRNARGLGFKRSGGLSGDGGIDLGDVIWGNVLRVPVGVWVAEVRGRT